MREELKADYAGLTEGQRSSFAKLIDEYSDIFAHDSADLGRTDLAQHEIDTGSAEPVKQAARRLPPFKRDVVDRQLKELLEQGRIEPSNSPWSSPIVLAKKRDGTYRLCVDYRRVNALTVKSSLCKAYRDTREHLQTAQQRQKKYLNKGMAGSTYSAGDLVFLHDPHLRVGEKANFHRNWKGPYLFLDQVTKVTYQVKQQGCPRARVKTVHFNNPKLYQRAMREPPEPTPTGQNLIRIWDRVPSVPMGSRMTGC